MMKSWGKQPWELNLIQTKKQAWTIDDHIYSPFPFSGHLLEGKQMVE